MTGAYLICPVRNVDVGQVAKMYDYVNNVECYKNVRFHFPHRDVDQTNDDGGIRICKEHALAMERCEEVHVWFNRPTLADNYDRMCMVCGKPTVYQDGLTNDHCCKCPDLTQGSYFDLGMAFALHKFGKKKRFVIANGPIERTEEKSFINVLLKLVEETKL